MPSQTIHRSIKQWLSKQILVQHKQGRCVKVILHHVGTSGKLGPEICVVNVGEFKESGHEIDDGDIEQYTGELESEATSYAEGVGTTQTFAIAAYFEEDEERPLARHAFRVAVEGLEGDDDVSSEPANSAGLQKQLMRHLEGKERIQSSMLGSVLHTLQKQNEQLSTMVTRMMESRVEELQAAEELISTKHQRDMELEDQKQTNVHKGQLLDNLLALLPAVANKAMGRKIIPETTDPIQLQLMKLVEALTEKDVEGLLNAVPEPEKKIALIQTLQLVKEAVDARDAAKQAQSNGNGGKAS